MKKIATFLIFNFSFLIVLFSQTANIKCYPTNWWAGMKWNKLQVMLHGDKISEKFPMIKMGPGGVKLATGVRLLKIDRVENPNYVFLDLRIEATAKPGKFSFPFLKDIKLDYELKERRPGNGVNFAQGVTSRDFIYLIMPDRFSNGDSSNDRVPGMKDQSLNRDSVFERHGGDLQGIQNHLDYLQSLGVTTLWLNPVIVNDIPNRTEHGYAFTDHYTVDPRIGGDKGYEELVQYAHAKNMKIIQDAVYNHVGINHITVIDMPMKSWLHEWPVYTNTTYKDQAVFDPHGSVIDKQKMTDGWFTTQMPDLNQSNEYVANFLIQHALWTVEEFGVDGWRIDTYSYNDLNFMNRCNKALMDEYPKLTMFGETWVHGVPNQSYFAQNNFDIPFKSNLQATTDFQVLWGITDAMTKDFGWTDGVNVLYTTLAQDFVYKNPMREVIFLDNHDMARFFSVVGEDVVKYESALAWLLTCRGIPQIYYGDEIGLTGFTYPNDGHVRQDFPGGWIVDSLNKFTIAGRSAQEERIWRYIAKLANFRKTSSAITTGKLMQYVPQDGVYVYFRYDNNQTVMVAMNTSKEQKMISPGNYLERTDGFSKMKNVITGDVTGLKDFYLDAKGSAVYELMK
ncbi:MAG TPA: alpha-amylase family glycosyl hydrolase [Chitinophagaceae bacterium]|nr:alpha-amylase family glycosyl hydrolase [Chitinophagaceae bacterium]